VTVGEQQILQGNNTPCCLNTSTTQGYSGPACWYCGQFRRSVWCHHWPVH